MKNKLIFLLLLSFLLYGCDNSFFVITLSDIIGLGIIAIVILIVVIAIIVLLINEFIVRPIKKWKKKREKISKAKYPPWK